MFEFKTNSKRLTIVVPAYNAAATVGECLDSIFAAHNNADCEVIVIDDGSRDNTPEVLRAYAESHSCPGLRIIAQENRGVAAARNLGIDSAAGKYVSFVDADDHLAPGGYNPLLEAAETRGNPDMVAGGTVWRFADGRTDTRGLDLNLTSTPNPGFEIYDKYREIDWQSMWGKIYRADFLRENNLSVAHGIVRGEDTEFNMHILQRLKSVLYVSQPVYYYSVYDTGSAMTKFMGQQQIESYVRLITTRLEMIRKFYPQEPQRQKQLDEGRALSAYNMLQIVYNLYTNNVPRKYRWLKSVNAAAERLIPDWKKYLAGRSPRMFAKMAKFGLWLPHIAMIASSKISPLRRKLRTY